MSKRLEYRKKIQTMPPGGRSPEALETMGLLATAPIDIGMSLLGDPLNPMPIDSSSTIDMDRAYEQQDAVNKGLLGAGVGAAGIFVPEIRGRNKKQFDKFRNLEREGATPAELHRETRIHRTIDRDQTPLLEIDPDQRTIMHTDYSPEGKIYHVQDPKLKSYLPLDQMEVFEMAWPESHKGSYAPSTNTLGVNNQLTAPERSNVIEHELQHAVQNKYGMEPGSSEERMKRHPTYGKLAGLVALSEKLANIRDTAMLQMIEQHGLDPERADDHGRQIAYHELNNMNLRLSGKDRQWIHEYMSLGIDERDDIVRNENPYMHYRRTHGEALARAAQKREPFDQAYRESFLPQYDVHPDDIIHQLPDRQEAAASRFVKSLLR